MNSSSSSEIINQWASIPQSVIEAFGDEGDFARQHLLNPTLFSLLDGIGGKQILDAGCGNGYLARLLAQQGAQVTGLEPAPPLFDYAIRREKANPLGIEYVQADLTSWHAHQQFDVVIANMVLMDIPDYETAIETCFFHLRPGGHFLLSITHPCFEASDSEFLAEGHIKVKEYFEPYRIKQQWGDRFHRPLGHYFNALLQQGGIIKAVVEPQLNEEQAQHPVVQERNVHIPSFLVIKVLKPI